MFPVALSAPVGATDEPPEIEIVPAEAVSEPAPSYVVFGSIRTTEPLTAEPMLMLEPVEVTETVPELEVMVAPELVIAPEPEIVTLPLAKRAPVGATEVPPEIVNVPADAVREPAPE
jgi:hypothetical protein